MKHFDFNNNQDEDSFESFCACVFDELQKKAQKEQRAFGDFLIVITAKHLSKDLRQAMQFGDKEFMHIAVEFNCCIDFIKHDWYYYASVNAPKLSCGEKRRLENFIADVAADYWSEVMQSESVML